MGETDWNRAVVRGASEPKGDPVERLINYRLTRDLMDDDKGGGNKQQQDTRGSMREMMELQIMAQMFQPRIDPMMMMLLMQRGDQGKGMNAEDAFFKAQQLAAEQNREMMTIMLGEKQANEMFKRLDELKASQEKGLVELRDRVKGDIEFLDGKVDELRNRGNQDTGGKVTDRVPISKAREFKAELEDVGIIKPETDAEHDRKIREEHATRRAELDNKAVDILKDEVQAARQEVSHLLRTFVGILTDEQRARLQSQGVDMSRLHQYSAEERARIYQQMQAAAGQPPPSSEEPQA